MTTYEVLEEESRIYIKGMCGARKKREKYDPIIRLADKALERKLNEEAKAYNQKKREDYRRICACLNACEGKTTEELEASL